MVPRLSPGKFFGKKQVSREFGEVRIGEWLYGPSYRIPSHSHEAAYFGLVLQGTYSEDYGRKTRHCKPGSLLYHPFDEVHSEVHDEVAVRVLSIEVPPNWYDRVPDCAVALRSPASFQSGDVLRLATRLYAEFKHPDAVTGLAIEGIALELLALVCREQDRRLDCRIPAWLNRARELPHENHAQGYSLHGIAQEAGIHPAHLCRAFRSHYRCTIGEYVRNLRIQEARQVLAASSEPLGGIAVTLGYSDQSHFTTAFKRQTGMTPAQYRRENKLPKC